MFAGTQAHLEASSERTVRVWSDVLIHIDATSTPIVTRSDSVFSPILYTGSVQEIGGSGRSLRTLNSPSETASECPSGKAGAQCFPSTTVVWSNGNFSLSSTAPYWLEAGSPIFLLIPPLATTPCTLTPQTSVKLSSSRSTLTSRLNFKVVEDAQGRSWRFPHHRGAGHQQWIGRHPCHGLPLRRQWHTTIRPHARDR